MLTKSGFLALDRDTRAFTLVGSFMGFFAVLEAGINSAVGEVLEVEVPKLAIISRNMTLNDKINALRALVDFYVYDKEKAATFDRWALRARKLSEYRNMVAHTPFRASPSSDGVEFFTVEAKKQLKFPTIDWSIDDFLNKIDDINEVDNNLRSIKDNMSLQRIARLLMEKPPQNIFGGLLGLGAKFQNGLELDPDHTP
jgi:hypothetical protein